MMGRGTCVKVSVGLPLERGVLIEITGNSVKSTKTFLRGEMSTAEAVFCQLAVSMAPEFPPSPTVND